MVLFEQQQTQLEMRDSGSFTTNFTPTILSLITILGVSILVGSLMGSTLGIEPGETTVTYGSRSDNWSSSL